MSRDGRMRIAGVGLYVPPRILTNSDLEKMVDTSDEWITTRTGIKERHIADPGVSASDLAIPAAKEALEKAGLQPTDIDLIICATTTPDMMFPSTACFIQKGIGAEGRPAFDILAACSGFIYGLTVAESFIKSGAANNVLLVATEVYSQITNWSDRNTCVLFGDGAAAVVLNRSVGLSGVIGSRIFADGTYADVLYAGAGSRNPITETSFAEKSYCIGMNGNKTFKIAVTNMSEVALSLLSENGLTAEDVKLVIPHQANVRIINAVGKNLGIPEEKFFINVSRYGNTSGASIPIALYEALAAGRIVTGDLVLFVAFGGGLTWGASLIRW